MKLCVVISNSFAFLKAVENGLRRVLEPWRLEEAVDYAQALRLLEEIPAQLVLVDDTSMESSPEPFFEDCVKAYPDTWFVSVGQRSYSGAVRLEPPITGEIVGFFMQNDCKQGSFPDIGFWMRNYTEHVYPILLSHLFTGLLNGWVLSDSTLIRMAARQLHMNGLENMRIMPILVKTIHKSKVEASHYQAGRDHLFFERLLIRQLLKDSSNGAALDRYAQKWAVLAYMDVAPCSPEEMRRRCEAAAQEAAEHSWQLRFYIGNIVTPETLMEHWTELESLSETDVGYAPGVVQSCSPTHRQIAAFPDMQAWEKLLEQGKCSEVYTRIESYITPLSRQDLVNEPWLVHFRSELLQVIYRALRVHGIPAEKVLPDQLQGEDFQRAASSVPLILSWARQILDRMEHFLSSEQADTVVKKAQKYILSHLDEALDRDSVAAQVFVSGGYLGRLFKKELNMSLSEYVFQARMKLASKMLEQTDLFVTSIAMNVGYSNFPYFSTQFKRFSGHTPVEYRKLFQGEASKPSAPAAKPSPTEDN